MRPRQAEDPRKAAILVTVIRLHRPTLRAVALDAGVPLSTTFGILRQLQAEGFVDWRDARRGTRGDGTLHATCQAVPV